MQITSHNLDEYSQQYQEKLPVYEAFALRLQKPTRCRQILIGAGKYKPFFLRALREACQR